MSLLPRLTGVMLGLVLLVLFLAEPAFPLLLAPPEKLAHGSFESGFGDDGVGRGWSGFSSGGDVSFRWASQSDLSFVWDGSHAQEISISSFGRVRSESDRYAGIYQRLRVTPGETYLLTLRGNLRLLEPGMASGRQEYGLQWGIDWNGGSDADYVEDWIEIPWEARLANWSHLPDTYVTALTAETEHLTLFIRAVKKNDTPYLTMTLTLDGLGLRRSQHMPLAGMAGFQGPTLTMTIPAHWHADDTRIWVSVAGDAEIMMLLLYLNGDEVGRHVYPPGVYGVAEAFPVCLSTDGEHLLRAEARDRAGNVGIVTQRIIARAASDGSIEVAPFPPSFAP